MTDLTNKTVEDLRDITFWRSFQEGDPILGPFDELARRLAAAEAERDEAAKLVCIASDYLPDHWDMESAPLNEIKDFAIRALKSKTTKQERSYE